VDGQHRHGVRVRVQVGCRRIVARVDERLQVPGHEHGAVIAEQRGLGPDDVEEAGDIGQARLRTGRLSGSQPGQHAAAAQERVQDLTGRALVGQLEIATHVGDERSDLGPARRAQADEPGLLDQLLQHGPYRSIASPGGVHDGAQVLAIHADQVRAAQRVDVDAGVRISHHPQERHEDPDVGPPVQA
jgi:hypothetical protein